MPTKKMYEIAERIVDLEKEAFGIKPHIPKDKILRWLKAYKKLIRLIRQWNKHLKAG